MLGIGVQKTGQGHATIYPRLVAERLGIPAAQIVHRHGDSPISTSPAIASVGSRSAMTAGGALVKTHRPDAGEGKAASRRGMLEAAEADIAYEDGSFEVVGTDRRISLFEVAARAAEMKRSGEIAEDLDTKATADTPQTFPNGCHIAEVEIDPDTGRMEIVAYTAVDDCGNVLDHMIVEGQLHGALAQGLGQALMEHAVYDDDSGQLVTGSFMDYAMPRADDMPPIRDAAAPACRRPPIRSASRASAKPAPPPRSPR